MPEFDELRLHINLDDQASAGLARLRNEIGSLGGGNAGRGFDQTRAQIRTITMLTRTLESGSLSARNAMNLLGLSFGGTAVAAGSLAYAFIAQSRNLKEFSDKIIELGNRSRAVGAEGGEIANIVKQLQRMGIAEAEASRFATTYVQRIGELSDVNSGLRTALQNRAGDAALDMRDYINRQIGAVGRGDIASAMNEHIRGAHNMVREKLNDPTNRGGTVSSAFELNENAKIWGLDVGTLAQITGDLRSSTVEQRAIWERQKIAAEAFAASYREVTGKLDEFNKGMMSSMVGAFDDMGIKFDASIIDAHGWGRRVGDVMGRALEEAAKFIDELVDILEWFEKFRTEPKKITEEAEGSLASFMQRIGMRMTGGGASAEKVARAHARLPAGGVQFFQKGGIVTRPTMAMIGEAGPEAVVPLTGGSDLASNMGFVKRALEWSGAMEPLKEALPTLTPAAASEIMSWAHAVDVPGAGLLSIAFDLFGLGVDIGQRGASKAFSQREMSKYAPAAGPVLTALELTQAGLGRENVQQGMKDYILKAFPGTPPENAQVFVDKIVEFSTAETKGAAPRGFFSGMFRPGASRQYGGPVSAGQSYLVGEGGPETFMPGRSEVDLRQSMSARRDNTYAFAASERPANNLLTEVRRLNDWYRQRKAQRQTGATDTGAGPSSVGGGGGYGLSGDFGGGNQFGIGGEGNAPPGGMPGGAPPGEFAPKLQDRIFPQGELGARLPAPEFWQAPEGAGVTFPERAALPAEEEPVLGPPGELGARLPAPEFWQAREEAGVRFPQRAPPMPPGGGAPFGGRMGGAGAAGRWEEPVGPPNGPLTEPGGDRPRVMAGTGELTPNKYDPSNRRIAASVRNANVGAAWPTDHDYKYGGKVGVLYDPKNRIAQFSTVEGGMASNMELLLTSKHYKGKTIRQAIWNWSGKNRSTVFGDARDNQIIHPGLLDDPEFRRAWFHIKAKAEAGKSWITDAQIDTAYDIYKAGGLEKWRAQRATPDQTRTVDRTAPITGDRPSQLPSSQQPPSGAGTVTGFRRGSEGSYVPEGYTGDSLKKRMGRMRPFEINPDLAAILEYSAEKAGATAVITSGAQESVDAAYKRGGSRYRPSERHTYRPGMNKLGAADVQFQVPDGKGGMRTLNPNVPADQQILAKITKQAAALGASGMGAQYGDMGSSVHIGGKGTARDKVGVYKGGDWLRQSFAEGWKQYLAGPPKEDVRLAAKKDEDRAAVDGALGKEATARADADITVKAKVTAPDRATVAAKSDGAIKTTEVEQGGTTVVTKSTGVTTMTKAAPAPVVEKTTVVEKSSKGDRAEPAEQKEAA